MDESGKKLKELTDHLAISIEQILIVADEYGVEGWHFIRIAEGRAWEARVIRENEGLKRVG